MASLNTCCLIGGRTFRVIMTLEEAGKKFKFSVDILKKSVSYGFIKIEDFILESGKVGYGCAYLAGPRMVGCAILVQIPGYLVEVAADSAVLGGNLNQIAESSSLLTADTWTMGRVVFFCMVVTSFLAA